MPTVKAAFSIPDDVFAGIDALARARGVSRSQLVTESCRRTLRDAETAEYVRQINEFWGSLTDEQVEEELALVRAAARHSAKLLDELDMGWDDS